MQLGNHCLGLGSGPLLCTTRKSSHCHDEAALLPPTPLQGRARGPVLAQAVGPRTPGPLPSPGRGHSSCTVLGAGRGCL